ncbi:MAG: TlpA family protein disulfide reductase [Vicinamibacteria bacterium]
MKSTAGILLLVLFTLLSSSCNAPEGAATGGATGTKPAPDLVLQRIDGSGTVSLAEQKGKVVLVDLWATWCAPCISELPHLQALSEKYGPEDFLMLGIVLESGDPEEIQAFIAEKEVRYPQVLGEDGTKESFGPFLGYPTKYLIDREGRVVKRYFGVRGDEIATDVQKLIETGSLGAQPAD